MFGTISAVCVSEAYAAHRAAGLAALEAMQRQFDASRMAFQPFRTGDKPADKSLEELAREHRARMEASHTEAMRGARNGALLLAALVLTLGALVAGVI